jgi:hypothetical protein
MFNDLKQHDFHVKNITRKTLGYMLSQNPHPDAVQLLEEVGNINWFALSQNGSFAAIDLIECEVSRRGRWFDDIDDAALSMEPLALPLLERNKEHIDWRTLSANPAASHLIDRNPDTVNWKWLAQNPSLWACEMMEANLDKVDWTNLSSNPSPHAIRLLEANEDKIDWGSLSLNIGATSLLEKHPSKIDWSSLVFNPSPFAARMLKEHQDKIIWWWNLNVNRNPDIINMLYTEKADEIEWGKLSENPAAIHLLDANPDKIRWFDDWNVDCEECSVWCNPAIFDDESGPPVLK